MRVLVTGGGGFLGNNLVRRLLARGEDVSILARGEYPALAALGVRCLRGDVRDPESLRRAVEGASSVFHVAAKVGYWGRLEDYVATNVGGAKNVVAACMEAGVGRLVYTSSPSVVIGAEGGLAGADETTPYAKVHLYHYAATKAEAEAFVLGANGGAHARGRLLTCALRPHFIFGPGDPQIVPRLLENARRGTLVRIGDGTNKVDVTYIDNAVDAHLAAHDALGEASARPAGQAYFIGQESPVVLWDFIDTVLRAFGAPPVRRRVSYRTARALGAVIEGIFSTLGLAKEPPLTRSVAVIMGTSHFFSHAKAHRDFGYAPAVSTEEGLRRLFAAEGAAST